MNRYQAHRHSQGTLRALLMFELVLSIGSPSLAASPDPDPCSLTTKAEVEQVVSKLKGEPKREREGGAAWCDYDLANGKDSMEIWVFPADGIERGRKQATNPVTVKGFGDDAFMDRGNHGVDSLDPFIKKGTVTGELSIRESSGDEAKLRTLVKKALASLQPVAPTDLPR